MEVFWGNYKYIQISASQMRKSKINAHLISRNGERQHLNILESSLSSEIFCPKPPSDRVLAGRGSTGFSSRNLERFSNFGLVLSMLRYSGLADSV